MFCVQNLNASIIILINYTQTKCKHAKLFGVRHEPYKSKYTVSGCTPSLSLTHIHLNIHAPGGFMRMQMLPTKHYCFCAPKSKPCLLSKSMYAFSRIELHLNRTELVRGRLSLRIIIQNRLAIYYSGAHLRVLHLIQAINCCNRFMQTTKKMLKTADFH